MWLTHSKLGRGWEWTEVEREGWAGVRPCSGCRRWCQGTVLFPKNSRDQQKVFSREATRFDLHFEKLALAAWTTGGEGTRRVVGGPIGEDGSGTLARVESSGPFSMVFRKQSHQDSVTFGMWGMQEELGGQLMTHDPGQSHSLAGRAEGQVDGGGWMGHKPGLGWIEVRVFEAARRQSWRHRRGHRRETLPGDRDSIKPEVAEGRALERKKTG